jgi:hypothetical protein
MAQNRAQFQRGMSITEFLPAFGDEAKCSAGGRSTLARRILLPALR